jgi:hypothetical protein
MYWIEISFINGKTLRKEYENLNDSYAVYSRYCCGNPNKKHPVQKVRAGYGEEQTFECDHMEGVCM